jgi:hypothetical protein
MTDGPDDLTPVVERICGRKGQVCALDLSPLLLQDLLSAMPLVEGDRPVYEIDTRLVLGAACTTAARAVDQVVAALQLPYLASRGWEDMFQQLGDRAASHRSYVFVADAGELLRYEELQLWHRLVAELRGGPYCLGGGWTTLVLVDDGYGWSRSRFGTAARAEEAARAAFDNAERPR